jgi:predicted nucleic acid-binding protein
MATRVVVDSGVLLSEMLPDEPLNTHAIQLLDYWQQNIVELTAPILIRYELVAVLRKVVYQKRINEAQGKRLLAGALAYPIQYFLEENLLNRAYELATLYNRPTAYDSQYLALAEKLQCEFWTSDERLYNAVQNKLSWINWLGNFTSHP